MEHMDRTSEFVAMAARLLEIKSRWLLPKPAAAEEDPDQLENDLIRQLELYRQYKQASGLLRQKEQQAALVFYRLPEERYREERIEPGNLTLEKLVAAFEKMQLRLAQPGKGRRPGGSHPARRLYREGKGSAYHPAVAAVWPGRFPIAL